MDELYINIGSNKITLNSIFNIFEETETTEEMVLRKMVGKEEPEVKTDIIVSGIDDIKVNIASCCSPIPGDKIIGYITKGYGISIHRVVCPNVSELEERIIDVKWNNNIEKRYSTTIIIKALKTDNMLLNIISKTAGNNISIQTVHTYNDGINTTFTITLLVSNVEILKKFMNDLKAMSNVLEVERYIK